MKVLSLEGGGIRGIYTLGVLKAIRGQLPIATKADLTIGTSTGGILAAAIGFGKDPDEVMQLYLDKAGVIFNIPFWWKVKTAGGLLGPKHPLTGLEKCLKEFFGEARIGDAVNRFMVTAGDTKNAAIILPDSANPKYQDMKVVDACLLTAAAPTYFPSWLGQGMNVVDGGVFAGSPVLIGYNEMLKAQKLSEKGEILNIGTGYKTAKYADTRKFGAKQWILKDGSNPLIDILLQFQKQIAHYTLDLKNSESTAFKFNTIDRELTDAISMDSTDVGKLKALYQWGIEDGQKYLQDQARFYGTGAKIPDLSVKLE